MNYKKRWVGSQKGRKCKLGGEKSQKLVNVVCEYLTSNSQSYLNRAYLYASDLFVFFIFTNTLKTTDLAGFSFETIINILASLKSRLLRFC